MVAFGRFCHKKTLAAYLFAQRGLIMIGVIGAEAVQDSLLSGFSTCYSCFLQKSVTVSAVIQSPCAAP